MSERRAYERRAIAAILKALEEGKDYPKAKVQFEQGTLKGEVSLNSLPPV